MSTFRDDLAAYLRARSGEWLDGMELAHVGGCYAYRTRLSECRTQLGMTIENRQRKVGDITVSEYRFVPARPVQQPRLFETRPW